MDYEVAGKNPEGDRKKLRKTLWRKTWKLEDYHGEMPSIERDGELVFMNRMIP